MLPPLDETPLIDAHMLAEDNLARGEKDNVAHRLPKRALPLETILPVTKNVPVLSRQTELALLLTVWTKEKD